MISIPDMVKESIEHVWFYQQNTNMRHIKMCINISTLLHRKHTRNSIYMALESIGIFAK